MFFLKQITLLLKLICSSFIPRRDKKKKVGGARKLAHGMLVFKKTRVNLMEAQASRAVPPEFVLFHGLCSEALLIC